MERDCASRGTKLKCKFLVKYSWITAIAEAIFIITSFTLATQEFFEWKINRNSWVSWAIFGVWLLAIIIKIWSFLSNHFTMEEFRKLQLSEELSASTLLAQQHANEAKARAIQQITYGHVPEWHPIDFNENVLVYDIHEQLRTILIEIRNAVLAYAKETDFDMVTVDLAYCYPDSGYNGALPTSRENSSVWKIITSGDSSCTNYKLHDFLGSAESFYSHLDRNNYVFFNDKEALNRYYLPSGKDHEYGGIGSIVGMAVSLKNDAPESVLVKAILTITTYGWKICPDDRGVSEEAFIDVFKQKVLNGYKSLLKSELAQMYIRHMIRDKKMCPYTGIVMKDEGEDPTTLPQPPFHCPLNPEKMKADCPNKTKECKCLNSKGSDLKKNKSDMPQYAFQVDCRYPVKEQSSVWGQKCIPPVACSCGCQFTHRMEEKMGEGIPEKEYLMLREEVQCCLKEQRNLSTFSITAVITIIGFTVQMDNPIPDLFLLPYIVLIIAAIKEGNYRQNMVRIVAYMIERHEKPEGFLWETCLNDYRQKNGIGKRTQKAQKRSEKKCCDSPADKKKTRLSERLSRFLDTQEYAAMGIICLILFAIYTIPQFTADIELTHLLLICSEIAVSIGSTILLVCISKDYCNLDPDLIESNRGTWCEILSTKDH